MPQNLIIFLCCGDIDHTRKHSKVEPSDGHISTTKKDNKICGTFIIDQDNQTNSLSISKFRKRYILTNTW